jgi:prepilin-type N-terminal cleavage/methylation domain-containing protein
MRIKQEGFTLIELLIALLIGVMIMLAIYKILEENQRIFNSQQQITNLDHEARFAMQTIVRSIRQAGSGKKSLKGVPKIYRAEENKLRLLSDLPHDVHGSDTWIDANNPGPNGSTFDIADGPDADSPAKAGNADDENENGDLILNDYDEDITIKLTPDPCSTPPCTLVKREFSDTDPYPLEFGDPANGIPALPVPTGAASYPSPYDEVLADNILDLSFEYFADSTKQLDWQTGTDPKRIELDDLNRIRIVRVTLVGRSNNIDRATGKYHTIQLTVDVDVRNQ